MPGRSSITGWFGDVLGIRIAVGRRDPAGPYLIAVKHQSMFETLEMLRFARTPMVVIKRELTGIPVVRLGHAALWRHPVDREAGAKALRTMMAEAKAAVAGGPAGPHLPGRHAGTPGETPPLQAGFAGLYRALGLPVVPVAHGQRPAVGPRASLKRSRNRPLHGRRVDPAGPEARRDRGARSRRRSTRWN